MTIGRKLSGRVVAGMLGAVTATAMSVSACGVSFAGGNSSGVTASGINVCELAPPSQVAALAGHKVVHAKPGRWAAYPNQKPNVFTCRYSLSTGIQVRIQVTTRYAKAIFGASKANLSSGGTLTRLHGIGDEAFESNVGLAVRDGNYNILIAGYGWPDQWDGHRAGLVTLAKNMISALV